MNEYQSNPQHIWLFLAALLGMTIGRALINLELNIAHLVGGFLTGISVVGMGAFICLASRQQSAGRQK